MSSVSRCFSSFNVIVKPVTNISVILQCVERSYQMKRSFHLLSSVWEKQSAKTAVTHRTRICRDEATFNVQVSSMFSFITFHYILLTSFQTLLSFLYSLCPRLPPPCASLSPPLLFSFPLHLDTVH